MLRSAEGGVLESVSAIADGDLDAQVLAVIRAGMRRGRHASSRTSDLHEDVKQGWRPEERPGDLLKVGEGGLAAFGLGVQTGVDGHGRRRGEA
jgi:hypothetical protein